MNDELQNSAWAPAIMIVWLLSLLVTIPAFCEMTLRLNRCTENETGRALKLLAGSMLLCVFMIYWPFVPLIALEHFL